MCSHFFCAILCFNAITQLFDHVTHRQLQCIWFCCSKKLESMLAPSRDTIDIIDLMFSLTHTQISVAFFFRCGIPQLTQWLSVIDEFITCVQFYSLFCVMLSGRLEYIRQIRGNPVCSRGMCHTEYSLIQLRSDAHFTITSFDLMLLPQKKRSRNGTTCT